MPEGKIQAAGEVFRAEALLQHLGHERLVRHKAKGVVERQLEQHGHAESGQGFGPLSGQRQPERRVVRAKHLPRVRLEGQHRE